MASTISKQSNGGLATVDVPAGVASTADAETGAAAAALAADATAAEAGTHKIGETQLGLQLATPPRAQ